MTAQNVRDVFGVEDLVVLPAGIVPVETFAAIFAVAPAVPTYDDLMEIDAGAKGYKPFFDACKADGILS